MKKWVLLGFLPLFLFAHDYYGEVPEAFSAKVVHKSQDLKLDHVGEVEIQARYPSHFSLKLSDFDLSEKDADVEYRLAKASHPKQEGEMTSQTFSIQYEPFVEGIHHLDLPLFHFESKTEPHKKHVLYPPSIECEVKMADEDPVENLEVASPLSLDGTPPVELDIYNKKVFFQKSDQELQQMHQKLLNQAPKMTWKWFVLAFGVGYLGFKLYQLITKRKTLQTLFSPAEDPRKKALKALRELKAKNLPQKGRYEDFYVEITQIVRQYIEGHYKIKAPEQTTQEFLQIMLGQAVFNETINHYLTEFLKFSDLVKFAKFNPKVEDCSQAEEAAESFIQGESEKSSSH